MFGFNRRDIIERDEEKKILEEIKDKEKPSFKDLVAIMFAQYLIIIPILVIGVVIFGLLLYLITNFWLS